MTDRYDALSIRAYTAKDGTEKKAFTKLGVAFPTKNGGWMLQLDAIPAPQDGTYKILLSEPKPREEKGGDGAADYRKASGGRSASDDLSDSIPF